MIPSATTVPDGRGVRGRAYVPTLVAIGLVVSVVSALGAQLIPTMAGDLGASLGATQWALTATLLVGAVASPLIGRLGDGPHRRTVLLVCLALVTLGGAIAALASSLGVLIAGRALQGLGLALMPLTMASARDHLAPRHAASTIAVLSVTAAVGVGLGFPITGLVAELGGTSAAFWFGTAATAVAFVLAALYVPAPARPAQHDALDLRGAALIGGGVLALLLAVENAPDWGWAATPTLALSGAAVALLALWTVNELRVPEPLVELRLVKRRAVLTANATALVLGVAMYLAISLVTQVVQLRLHHSILVAGLTLVPLSLGSTISSRRVETVRGWVGPRGAIPFGAALLAVGFAFLGATGDALWQACVTMGFAGLGLGLTFAAMPGLIVGSVPQHETSSAMSFYQVTRYVGFSVGAGLAVTLLRAFDGSYSAVFWCGAGLCLVAALVAYVLPGQAPMGLDHEREVEEGELGAAGGFARFDDG